MPDIDSSYVPQPWLSRYRIGLVGAGGAALALLFLGSVPGLPALLGLVYGWLLPAFLLRRYVAQQAPGLPPSTGLLLPLLALIPVWVLIFALLWTFDQSLTATTGAALAVTVVLVTVAMLVRGPAAPGAWRRPRGPALRSSGLVLLGGGLGLLAVILGQWLHG
ncbi:MAG TPA: hypothetical protein VKY74_12735 [Chloroflexia bacterium]|nr:hypothetical protein [Chloroflexia bacterium]